MAYATATTSNTSYRFVVSTVDTKDESSLTDVIKSVDYTLYADYDDGGGAMLTESVDGSFNCTNAASSNFIGFSTITSSDISSWTDLTSKKSDLLTKLNTNHIDVMNSGISKQNLPSEI